MDDDGGGVLKTRGGRGTDVEERGKSRLSSKK
jgi:hypothetical protein